MSLWLAMICYGWIFPGGHLFPCQQPFFLSRHFSLGFENEFFSWLEKNFKLKIENKEKQDYEKFSEIDDPLTISSDLTAIKKNTYLYYEKDYLLSNSVLDKLKEEGQ